jgi:hypothetical protein
MKTIEYKATYNGTLTRLPGGTRALMGSPSEEVVRVQARDINSGFAKALKRANEPLGNGNHRELARIEFWQVV